MKKKVFRKEIFIKDMLDSIIRRKDYNFIIELAYAIKSDGWATYFDGKEVINGYIGKYEVHEDWCEEVEYEEEII